MKRFSMITQLITGISLLLVPFAQSQAQSQSLTIFAAASMALPITEIAKSFEQHQGVKVISVFAASSTLARQIERGAPADIYISANHKWMDYLLKDQQLVASSVQSLLENQLVLSAPINSDLTPVKPLDTNSFTVHLIPHLKGARLATGNTDHVPLGIYAKQALVSLDIWQTVRGKLALTSNARAALAFVEKAAVPLAIIYKTDAVSSKKVKIIATIDERHHDRIQYPMALVNNHSTHNVKPAAERLFAYLKSASSAAVFRKFGFRVTL